MYTLRQSDPSRDASSYIPSIPELVKASKIHDMAISIMKCLFISSNSNYRKIGIHVLALRSQRDREFFNFLNRITSSRTTEQKNSLVLDIMNSHRSLKLKGIETSNLQKFYDTLLNKGDRLDNLISRILMTNLDEIIHVKELKCAYDYHDTGVISGNCTSCPFLCHVQTWLYGKYNIQTNKTVDHENNKKH